MLIKCAMLFFPMFLFSVAQKIPFRKRTLPKNEIILEGCDVMCQPALKEMNNSITMFVTLNGTRMKEVICGHESHESIEMFRSHIGNRLETTRIRMASLCNGTLHYLQNLLNSNGDSIAEVDLENVNFSLSPSLFNTLKRLQQLKKLHMTNNDLSASLEPFLKKFNQLEELFVSGNRLEGLSLDRFHVCTSLKTLVFLNNTLEISQQDLKNLTQLKELHVDKFSLDILVNNDTFVSMKELEILNLTRQVNPPIKLSLSADIFRENRQLKELILRRNSIRGFHRDTFANLNQLKTLDMSYNSLNESLISDCFRNLSNLENLILMSNNLQYLPQDMFRGLENLQTLVLSMNNFANLSDKATPFYHVPNVKMIDLFNSRVQHLAPNWFTGLTQLELINLEYNSIETLIYTDLLILSRQRDPKLLAINLKGNDINNWLHFESCNSVHQSQKVNSTPKGLLVRLDSDIFGICDKEQQTRDFLNLQRDGDDLTFDETVGRISSNTDEIKDLPPITCSCFCEERFLPCSCQIDPGVSTISLDCIGRFTEGSFDPIVFRQMIPHLKNYVDYYYLDVDLSNNNLGSYIHNFDWLHDIPVRSLNLSFNKLSTFPLSNNWMEKVPKLKLLDLRSNHLEEIPTQFFQNKSEDSFSAYLEGNQFRCECSENSWLNQNLDQVKNIILDFDRLHCYFNETSIVSSLRLSDLKGFNYKTDHCKQGLSVKWISAAVVLIVFSIPASLFAVLLMKRDYSTELKEGDIRASSTASEQGANPSFSSLLVYDAFISYSHKDEEFVIKEIVPGLESPSDGSPRYQLCLHERDWLAGEWIVDQILQSIATSRRTIIVLSENFIHSYWGKVEFRAAYQQVIQSKERRLIVIIKDKVPDLHPLDEDLKLFIASNTYLRWADPLFWKKLRQAMAPKIC